MKLFNKHSVFLFTLLSVLMNNAMEQPQQGLHEIPDLVCDTIQQAINPPATISSLVELCIPCVIDGIQQDCYNDQDVAQLIGYSYMNRNLLPLKEGCLAFLLQKMHKQNEISFAHACNWIDQLSLDESSLQLSANYLIDHSDAINNLSLQMIKDLIILTGHNGKVRALAISSDGTIIVSGSWDKTIRLYLCIDPTFPYIKTLTDHSGPVNSVVFFSNGKKMASASHDKTVKLYSCDNDPTTFSCIKTLADHTSGVNAVALSVDEKILVSGCQDSTVRIYSCENNDPATFGCITVLKDHKTPVVAVAFSPCEKIFVSGAYGTVLIYSYTDPTTFVCIKNFTENTAAPALAFSLNGKVFAHSLYTTVFLYSSDDPTTFTRIKEFKDHKESISALAFSHNGKMLVSASWDKSLKLYSCDNDDPTTFSCMKTLTHYNDAISALVFSPDRKIFAYGYGTAVHIYPLTQELLRRCPLKSLLLLETITKSRDPRKKVMELDEQTFKLYEELPRNVKRHFSYD
jgi:WD40 repeat protein